MHRTKFLQFATLAALLCMMTVTAPAADESGYRIADGLVVYLGVMPAAMIQGHPKEHPEEAMHGGVPGGEHDFHVMVAVFDEASGERIEDARVEARVTPLGLATVTRRMEPMEIAGTVTYGSYFTMRGNGPYRIEISLSRGDEARPVTVEFSYKHPARVTLK